MVVQWLAIAGALAFLGLPLVLRDDDGAAGWARDIVVVLALSLVGAIGFVGLTSLAGG